MSRSRKCSARMNTEDAQRMEVKHNSEVLITSDWGEVAVLVEVSNDITAGAIGLTHGWGHSGLWKRAIHAGGQNYNKLTSTQPGNFDLPSGNAYFNGLWVEVSPISAKQSL